jgi:signal transduction histidine kinase
VRLRGAGGAFITIRGKILLAFLALAAITGMLGFGAINSVVEAGRLVVQTYDKPLMAISYARMAQVDFTNMRLAMIRRESATDPAQQRDLDFQLDATAQSVDEDLDVARERSSSQRAAAAATAAQKDFRAWNALRQQARNPAAAPGNLRDTLHGRAELLLQAFDTLGELTADDGFRDRERSLASIREYRTLCIRASLAALLLSVLVAVLLARHMVRPIAAASSAAGRIAAGELDVEIRPAGRDELGRLLASMTVMRDNIRAMMEREIAARRSAQGRLVNAIENLNEGVALVGADRRIVIANSPIAEFFQAGATSFLEGARLPPEIEAALAQPTGELHLRDDTWLRLSRSDTPDGGFVLIASDITLLKEREALLREAKEQAEAANRAKTDFLTNMSHELRTPLTAVIGFSEIIADESLGPVGQPKYREFATDILHSGRHLLDLINDILDIAKLQSGTTQLRLSHVRSRRVVDDAVRIVRKQAEAAGVNLELIMLQEPPLIEADHVRIRQVLLNLLSNAIKFTPAGGTVTVTVEPCMDGLSIVVRDTGIGMAAEDIPRALAPFGQVDSSLTRQHGGTGLGLPLSKLFIELHGGQFDIRSEKGKGTEVSIMLPVVVTPVRERIAA